MGLDYRDLDDATRRFMLEEIDHDLRSGRMYVSNYLNESGAAAWPDLLKEAAEAGNDDSLARRIRENALLKLQVERKKPSGGFTMANVPYTAPETLGEGEFNRYYVRGLCRHAMHDGVAELEVYRAKSVSQPRPGSEEKIGTRVRPEAILDDLRATPGVEPALGLPPGPNSGLTLTVALAIKHEAVGWA